MKKIIMIFAVLLVLLPSGCSTKEMRVKKSIENLIGDLFVNNEELEPFKDKIKIKNVNIEENVITFDLVSVDVQSVINGEDGLNFFDNGNLEDLLNISDKKTYHIELEYTESDDTYELVPTMELLNAVFCNVLVTYDDLMGEMINEMLENN